MFEVSYKYYENYDYNMMIYSMNEEEIDYIIKLDNIDEYFLLYDTAKHDYLRIYDKSKVELDNWEYEYDGEKDKYIQMSVLALDDASFRKYVKKAGLDYEKVKDEGILVDNYIVLEGTGKKAKEVEKRTYNYQEGDLIKGRYGESISSEIDGKYQTTYKNDREISIKVGAISNLKPYGREKQYYYGGNLIVNKDRFNDIEFNIEKILIQSSNPDKLEESLSKINGVGVTNIEKDVRRENSMILIVKIFLYGFISVITLIGVTNIFNTITSNMELRQKEFAMLKSIGMTKKEFNRMINLETIFYGTKSLIYGMILGMMGTYLLYIAFGNNVRTFAFPYSAIWICVISVFILIFIIMKYSVRKINKQNTIETIRKDNI
jgi:putative ABC transport system permease protein